MDTICIILPALVTLIFSILLIWLVAHIVKKNIPNNNEVKLRINEFAGILTTLILFFSIWWTVSLLSVNNVSRSTIDHTLNNQIRNSFKDRMISDTSKLNKYNKKVKNEKNSKIRNSI